MLLLRASFAARTWLLTKKKLFHLLTFNFLFT